MRGCRISAEWKYDNLQVVMLENELLKASILVDFGTKVFEFIRKSADRDFLYLMLLLSK